MPCTPTCEGSQPESGQDRMCIAAPSIRPYSTAARTYHKCYTVWQSLYLTTVPWLPRPVVGGQDKS